MYRGSAKEARECEGWPVYKVIVYMRAPDEKCAEVFTQRAYDASLYHEAKMIYFGSDKVVVHSEEMTVLDGVEKFWNEAAVEREDLVRDVPWEELTFHEKMKVLCWYQYGESPKRG